MNSLKIDQLRTVSEENLIQVARLDKDFLFSSWNLRQWREYFELNDSERRLLVVCKDSEKNLCGFSLFELNEWSDQAHLLKIVVSPEMRGLGAAMNLWKACLDLLVKAGKSEVFLEVAVQNVRANGFYNKLGFKELCVKKGFYSDGSDARAMLLSL